MFSFSHFNRIKRSKTSKFLTLAFVLSLLVHGLAQIATSVWLLVTSYSRCAFLQKYFVPIYTHVLSGVSAEILAFTSFISTYCYHYNGHVRIFIIGLGIIITLELSSILSAVVLDKMVDTRLPVAMGTSLTTVLNSLNDSASETELNCWPDLQDQYQCCGTEDHTDWCTDTHSKRTCDKKNNTLFESCKCPTEKDKQDKCITFDNETIYKASCLDHVSDKLTSTFRLIIAMDAAFCIMQCMSYLAVNCIMSKMNSQCVVGTYKPKPTESESRF